MDDHRTTDLPVADAGLLLPAESIALLAASREGALAVREFGLLADDFESGFDLMTTRLASSPDPDAAAALEVSRQIVALALTAQGWLSVRAMGDDPTPSLVLLSDPELLIVRLHGAVVEWVLGDMAAVARLVRLTAAQSSDAEVMVTAFSGGAARGGALFRGDDVDVAAAEVPQLERLAEAAGRGTGTLLRALTDVAREASAS